MPDSTPRNWKAEYEARKARRAAAAQVLAAEALWDINGLMAFLRVSRRLAHKVVHDKDDAVPHIKVGGAFRFFPHQVRAWAERQRPDRDAAEG